MGKKLFYSTVSLALLSIGLAAFANPGRGVRRDDRTNPASFRVLNERIRLLDEKFEEKTERIFNRMRKLKERHRGKFNELSFQIDELKRRVLKLEEIIDDDNGGRPIPLPNPNVDPNKLHVAVVMHRYISPAIGFGRSLTQAENRAKTDCLNTNSFNTDQCHMTANINFEKVDLEKIRYSTNPSEIFYCSVSHRYLSSATEGYGMTKLEAKYKAVKSCKTKNSFNTEQCTDGRNIKCEDLSAIGIY